MSISQFGNAFLGIAAIFAVYVLTFSFVAIRKKTLGPLKSVRNGVILVFVFTTLAEIVLLTAFLQDDFSLKYVWAHSNLTMPTIYKFSGLWSGQSGSVMFWLWLITLYCFVDVLVFWRKELPLMPYATAILAFVQLFFFVLIIYADNPFTPVSPIPADGRGLNPLLQNEYMMIHPVMMYMGFVGFTIPFAWALAALIRSDLRYNWVIHLRHWLIVPWVLVGVANVLGSKWAYVELGWGGFWAWDPVENAAIMPWLASTPLLHTAMVQEKREGFKFWNYILIFLTFFLTIFGTFITRSGFIESVHAFARSAIGYYFLIFLAVAVIICTLLLILKRRSIEAENIGRGTPHALSRENFFHYTNFLYIAMIAVITFGTVISTISPYLIGRKVTVTPDWFTRMTAPLGFLLLVALALAPIIGWKKTKWAYFVRSITVPLALAGLTLPICWLFDIRQPLVMIIAAAIVLTIALIVRDFVTDIQNRLRSPSEPAQTIGEAFRQALVRYNRKMGAFICHLAIAIAFLAFIGAAYKEERTVQMSPGATETIGNYAITYRDITINESDPNETNVIGTLNVYKANTTPPTFLGTLRPSRNFYPNQEAPTTEADTLWSLEEDLYIIMGGYDTNTKLAEFRFTINPLISFLWLAGILLLVGTALILIPFRRLLLSNSAS